MDPCLRSRSSKCRRAAPARRLATTACIPRARADRAGVDLRGPAVHTAAAPVPREHIVANLRPEHHQPAQSARSPPLCLCEQPPAAPPHTSAPRLPPRVAQRRRTSHQPLQRYARSLASSTERPLHDEITLMDSSHVCYRRRPVDWTVGASAAPAAPAAPGAAGAERGAGAAAVRGPCDR